jgi:hypothetical protein
MDNFEDIKNKYLELANFIGKYFPDKKTELTREKLGDNIIKEYTSLYVNGINSKSKYQNMLVDRNINMFHKTGHPNYIAFFPNMNIKKFLLVEDKYIQHIIWESLQIIYLLVENSKSEKWHELLLFKIENTECPPVSVMPEDKKQDVLDNMVGEITDIFKNFGEHSKGNMIENLMKSASGIAEKYNNDLSNEDLDISKVIRSVSKAFGQDENEMNTLINTNPIFQSLFKSGSPEDLMKNMKDTIGIDPTELLNNPSKILSGALGGALSEGLGGALSEGLGGALSEGLGGALSEGLGGDKKLGGILGGAINMFTGGKDNKNTSELSEEQIKEMEEFFFKNGKEFEKFLEEK